MRRLSLRDVFEACLTLLFSASRQEFQGDESGGGLLEETGVVIYIGAGVGAGALLLCLLMTTCHILIAWKLCCFKNAGDDTWAHTLPLTIPRFVLEGCSSLCRATRCFIRI
jgi:hypothetical protein